MLTASYVDVTSVVMGAASAVTDELATLGCGTLNRVCPIVPGDIAWDECDCGLFAQTITETRPSDNFPASAADQAVTACGPRLLTVSVQAIIVRCVPGVSDNGSSPSCEALQAAATTLECDRQALRHGIRCYLRELRESYQIAEFSVGVTTSLGPQGGCAGVTLTYQFGVQNVCCPA